MNTTELTARIEQVKANEVTNSKKLESLQDERARLTLRAGNTKTIDAKIADVRRDVESAPHELKLLENQLTEATAKQKQKAMDALVAEQQTAANSMEDLSKKLVTQLAAAVETNNKLQASIDRYVALQKQTGQTLQSPNCCRGSQQMLKVIYETCRAEVEGIKNPRTEGRPPYIRI